VKDKNIDRRTVEAFGDEWVRFDQSALDEAEASRHFENYFSVFPWDDLPREPEGFDMGCGSGRWARFVAPRVGKLHCVDPSAALHVAKRNLAAHQNVDYHLGSTDNAGIRPGSQDFGYSLGVLHHVPDTAAAIRSCVSLLKPGAPFLVYLYYSFDNRPVWFRLLWRLTDMVRRLVFRMPPKLREMATTMIALLVYWPLARASVLLERAGFDVSNLPLSAYRNCSFYTMRTDSRDRFGTPLEQRFSRADIEAMMISAGLVDIRFAEHVPYWCAVGRKG
jgi:SAM-dependent methyltransferase